MAVSGFFVKWWWVLVLLVAAAGIGYYSFRRTERGRIVLANYALTRSPLRRLRTMSASGQFAAALSAMLSAGLPMPKALSVAGEVSGNYMFALAAGKVRQSVERGRTVAEGMGEVKLFPPMLREMIGVGESSGTLVDTLDVVAQYFNSEVETITKPPAGGAGAGHYHRPCGHCYGAAAGGVSANVQYVRFHGVIRYPPCLQPGQGDIKRKTQRRKDLCSRN